MSGESSPYVELLQNFFVAKVTSYQFVSGKPVYTFTEQSFDPDTGAFLDADSPRGGAFLYELNNVIVSNMPTYVFARMRGVVDGDLVYEFAAGMTVGSSSSSSGSSSSGSSSGSSSSSSFSSSSSSSSSSTCQQIVTNVTCGPGGLVVTYGYAKVVNGQLSISPTPC